MWSYICPAAKSSGGGRSNRCSRLKCWPLTNRIGTKVRARAILFQKEPAHGEIGRCLAVYGYLADANWPVVGVKLAVDVGLLAIVLFSIMVGRPFTIQYARESIPKELWGSPQFLRTNQIIILVWLAAFAVIVVADLVLLYLPDVPHKVSVLMTIGALYGAFKFTMKYPDDRAKAKAT